MKTHKSKYSRFKSQARTATQSAPLLTIFFKNVLLAVF